MPLELLTEYFGIRGRMSSEQVAGCAGIGKQAGVKVNDKGANDTSSMYSAFISCGFTNVKNMESLRMSNIFHTFTFGIVLCLAQINTDY